jgi:hypothetical protein
MRHSRSLAIALTFAALPLARMLMADVINPTVKSPAGPVGCFAPPGYANASVCDFSDQTPLRSFPVPSPGETYTDPTFGSRIRLLSSSQTVHGYSTPSAFSATGKYVAVAIAGQQVQIIEVKTAKVVYSRRPGTVTADTIRWDAWDDEVYYWPSGARLMRHNLRQNRTDVMADYATDGHGFTRITAGGTGDISKDNWFSFWAPNEHMVCAIDLGTARTYCADYLAPDVISRVGISSVDFTLTAKGIDSVSRKRYILLMAFPALAVFSVDESRGILTFEYRGGELPPELGGVNGNNDGICDIGERCMSAPHTDTLEDSDGQQYLIYTVDMSTPCARQLARFRLNAGPQIARDTSAGGGRDTGLILHRCGGGPELWLGNHIGCARNAPYCALSTEGPRRKSTDLTSPIQATTHLGEIMILRGDLTEVRRIAHHRSVEFDDTYDEFYWAIPRASISSNGKMILWDSTFGYPKQGSYVAVTEANSAGSVGAALNSLEIVGDEVVLSLNSPAPAGGLACSILSSHPSIVTVPPEVLVPKNATTGTFGLTRAPVQTATDVTVTVSCGGTSRSVTARAMPPALSAIKMQATTYVGSSSSSNNRVILDGVAPLGGLTCQLSSSDPILVRVPSIVVVSGPASEAKFQVDVQAPPLETHVVLTAECGGRSRSVNLTVLPELAQPATVRLELESPAGVGGVASSRNRVVLERTTPSNEVQCTVTTSQPDILRTSSDVLTIRRESVYAEFGLAAAAVAQPTNVTVSAVCAGQVGTAVQTVLPPSLERVVLSSRALTGGSALSDNGIVLDGPAPIGGVTCHISTSDPQVLEVPTLARVQEGDRTSSFDMAANSVRVPTPVTIEVGCGNTKRSAMLTVLPVWTPFARLPSSGPRR